MKTKIIIEIECDGVHCGNRCKQHIPHFVRPSCTASGEELHWDGSAKAFKRCPACLAAEAEYKSLTAKPDLKALKERVKSRTRTLPIHGDYILISDLEMFFADFEKTMPSAPAFDLSALRDVLCVSLARIEADKNPQRLSRRNTILTIVEMVHRVIAYFEKEMK